jgi:hypothetical protein
MSPERANLFNFLRCHGQAGLDWSSTTIVPFALMHNAFAGFPFSLTFSTAAGNH